MRIKPNYKNHIIAFLLKTKLHPISTSFSRSLILKWSISCGCVSGPAVQMSFSLCMCVKTSDRGACVYTCMLNSFLWPVTSLRLMVRNVQQGGNLSAVLRPERITCNSMCLCGCILTKVSSKTHTHITWKGQLGVWMNLSSRM